MYSYPEGKYGPPLLREQPFFIASFGIFLAVLGYIKMEWRHKSAINYHLNTNPSFFKLAVNKFSIMLPRLAYVFLYSIGLLGVENIVLVPHTWLLYSLFVGSFRSLRRGSHSFWEFIDFRMFYHLAWAGASLLLLYSLVEIIVEYVFGRCFHLCRGLRAPNSVLLAGLQSPRTAVRNQALLELRHVTMNESVWRSSLFRDFIGEEAASKVLCRFFIKTLKDYSSHLQVLNEDLKMFSTEFERLSGDGYGAANVEKAAASASNIFSPRRRNILESILDTSEKLSRQASPPKAASIKTVPDILEIKARPLPPSTVPTEPTVAKPKYANKYVRLTVAMFGRFARYFPARVYASLSCEIIKSWWLGNEESIIWLLDALASFIVASYDEDCHGQVQFLLNDILLALSELLEDLSQFGQLPQLNGRRMLDDLFGNNPSPTEHHVRRISASTLSTLEMIVEKFSESLDQLKISPVTREKLRNLGLLL
ncbi:hypothetical protein PSACC_02301 [Paramicrosporidium saccamoebae]|uniref:Nucleoporin protein Ndc1-Nup n=1 Tax=Paramicrosporidium saccamoebae TaxID=1246581 RepID=A0A2H9TJF4_9FUNG|nr:hypothetical protein PSACC_02301 [Paramicrosporidium saccamoebae]